MPDDATRIYCIDTSAFVAFNRAHTDGLLPIEMWKSLDDLFAVGRIISHAFVFAEICPQTKKPDFLAEWIKNKAQYFYPVTTKQTQLVKKILEKFPYLIDHTKEIDEADPWLVSLAIEKRESTGLIENYSNLTVVCNEKVRSGIKIPAVCRDFKVPHINVKEFISDNGWKITLEK